MKNVLPVFILCCIFLSLVSQHEKILYFKKTFKQALLILKTQFEIDWSAK